jgi:hypothetical protein
MLAARVDLGEFDLAPGLAQPRGGRHDLRAGR